MSLSELSCKILEEQEKSFLRELILDSPSWQKVETNANELDSFIKAYETFNGEWLLWSIGEENVAVTFHVNESPSNLKPWIGTILIKKSLQKRGLGKRVLNELAAKLKSRSEKVIFAATPIEKPEWSIFLSKCGFEQYKLEEDELGNKYIILILPL